MNIDHIFIIVNPSAGKDEPILQLIADVFRNSALKTTVHILKIDEDPAEVARMASKPKTLIAVYGGDGSVTQAAGALINTAFPLAIIPGGTANVLSKELSIPQDTEEALMLLKEGNYELTKIDTGTINGRPFLLRINLGIMAEMITETDPGLKDKIGQLAYGVATVKSVVNAEPTTYKLTIDGQTINTEGVALTITNSGSMGIGQLQLVSGISVSDGLLDVVLLQDAGFLSIVKATGGALLGKETDAVAHWQGKNITVQLPNKQTYLCDDCEDTASELNIKVVPASLTVSVPLKTS
ncbi:diacylglycerol/lipid kinase family protein [Mucilaginibacter sp. HD30]